MTTSVVWQVGFFYALFFYKDVKYMDYFVFIKKIKRREEEEYITRRGVYGRADIN
jgi:hypothetical protein